MTGPAGNSEFCFPRRRFDLLLQQNKTKANFEKRAEIPATSGHLRSRAIAVNIARVIVNCFPFDVIVFALLPAYGIGWETVSLLDVMWP